MEEEIWDGLVKLKRRSVSGEEGECGHSCAILDDAEEEGGLWTVGESLGRSGGLNIERLPILIRSLIRTQGGV